VRQPLELVVLGAGPAYTDREGATGSSYLVTDGETRVLLDLGQGSFPRIFAELDPTGLDAVAISHLHPDHFIDLVPLRHYLRFEFQPPRRVRVLGPSELAERLDALHAEPGFAAEAFDLETLGETVRTIGSLRLESGLVTHTDESYGFRVAPAAGPGLVYSGDCGRADDLLPLLRSGDALLSEVSFGAGPVPDGVAHLDGRDIGRVAARADAGRVLLTHLQMGHDPDETVAAVRASYDGPVSFVWPGSRVTV
jgi:ribonuclease BN (tRNA processing enzyme)